MTIQLTRALAVGVLGLVACGENQSITGASYAGCKNDAECVVGSTCVARACTAAPSNVNSGGQGAATGATGAPFSAPLTFSATASDQFEIQRSSQVDVELTITRAAGHNHALTASLASAPAGISASPITIASNSSFGVITLSATAAAAISKAGAPIVINVDDGHGVSQNTQASLAVLGAHNEPDTSFDNDGLAGISYGASNVVALDRQGRIMLAGSHGYGGSFSIARLLESGTVDPSFGITAPGVSILDAGSKVEAMLFPTTGGVILVGSHSTSGNFALAKITNAGAYDTSFDTDGKVLTNVVANSGQAGGATSAALQSDGKIVVAGYGYNTFVVARYLPSGTLDTTFNGTGINWIDFPDSAGARVANAVAIDAAGRIILAGSSASGTSSSVMAIARLLPNGVLDSTLDTDGRLTIDCSYAAYDKVVDLALDSAGRIVLAGTSSSNNFTQEGKVYVARLLPTGAFDQSFSSGPLDAAGTDVQLSSLALDADGTLHIAARHFQGLSQTNAAIFEASASGSYVGEVNPFAAASLEMASSIVLLPQRGLLVTGWQGGALDNTQIARYFR